MSKYIPFTDEQKQRANSVDLADFLRSQGEEVIRSGADLRWKRHDRVTIRGNRWYQHSENKGGLAIDFVRMFYNMDFPDVVTMLINSKRGAGFAEADKKPSPPTKPFKLPEAHGDMRRVFAYLIKERCIDREVIRHFAKAGTLYEDAKFHNAVRLTQTLQQAGYENVSCLLPEYKDGNAQLQSLCQDEPEMAMSM